MPSRAYTSFLPRNSEIRSLLRASVSMPSRAYTSFLLKEEFSLQAETICVNALSGLYLISTYNRNHVDYSCLGSVNALSGLYLISTPHS